MTICSQPGALAKGRSQAALCRTLPCASFFSCELVQVPHA